MRTSLFQIADEMGIRYTWLAEKLGYTVEYLSRIKHGRVPITDEFQRRVCLLFPDIDPAVLFFAGDGSHANHSVGLAIKEAVIA